MNAQARVLLPSDVFPPRCGGAGWSAHALALALIERGHRVTAIVPRRKPAGLRTHTDPTTVEDVLGVPTLRLDYWAPRLPIVQNYFRFERLWQPLADLIVACGEPRFPSQAMIIHAQHVQSAAAAVLAGRRLAAPVIVTVRDHWPWDYFSTGLHGERIPYGRPQGWAALATDLVARLGPGPGALALPAIPYMLAHVRRRQQALRQADAVIAVSDYMARRLSGIVAPERLHVIPNMLDLAAIDAVIAAPQTTLTPPRPYMLFVGKLERNKGAQLLIEIFRALRALGGATVDGSLALPELVLAGSGPLRAELEPALAALGVQTRFLEWIEHEEVLRLMAGCELLVFPSAWGEPLSRVPLEASACRAPILAMPTGGTPSILVDGVSGALEASVGGFAQRLAALLADPQRRSALGKQARSSAEQRFAKEVVLQRVEELYAAVLK